LPKSILHWQKKECEITSFVVLGVLVMLFVQRIVLSTLREAALRTTSTTTEMLGGGEHCFLWSLARLRRGVTAHLLLQFLLALVMSSIFQVRPRLKDIAM
jgi:hypothetical protein